MGQLPILKRTWEKRNGQTLVKLLVVKMKAITVISIVILALSLLHQAQSAQLVKKWQEKQFIEVLKKWTNVYAEGNKAKAEIQKRNGQAQQQQQSTNVNNNNAINIHLHQLQTQQQNYYNPYGNGYGHGYGYQQQHQVQGGYYPNQRYPSYNRYPSPSYGRKSSSSSGSSRKKRSADW